MEDDVNHHFDCILDYGFKDGILLFKAQSMDNDIGKHTLTVPFPILKQDVQLEVAHFICDNMLKTREVLIITHGQNTHFKSTCKRHMYTGYNAHTMWTHYTVFTKQEGQRQIKSQRMPEQKFRQNTKIK
jgi:hypothetical protein